MTHFHVNKLEDFIDFDDTIVNKEYLLESPTTKVKLIALKKHQELPAHRADGEVMLYLLEGEIKLNIIPGIECLNCEKDDDACDEHRLKLKKGEFVRLSGDDEHYVFAEKDSKLLVICLHQI